MGTGRPQSPADRCRLRRLRDHRPPLRVPPWPGEGSKGRGAYADRGHAERRGFLPLRRRRRRWWRRGLSASPQTARRSASRQRICTHARALAARGPRARPPPPVAARAALTLDGRARKGRGAAAPPSPAPGGGARPAFGPAASGKGLQPERPSGAALASPSRPRRAGSPPLLFSPPPLIPSGGCSPASGNPGFPGRGPGPERAARTGARSASGICRTRSRGQPATGHTLHGNQITRCGDLSYSSEDIALEIQ